jgi:hypothetical protein
MNLFPQVYLLQKLKYKLLNRDGRCVNIDEIFI